MFVDNGGQLAGGSGRQCGSDVTPFASLDHDYNKSIDSETDDELVFDAEYCGQIDNLFSEVMEEIAAMKKVNIYIYIFNALSSVLWGVYKTM